MNERMKGMIIGAILMTVSIIGLLIASRGLPPIIEVKYQSEFAQEVSFSELLSLQSDLADEKIYITYRFMVLDTLVIPEAIVLIQGLNSKQLDIIAQKQAEYQKVLFGLRFRL